MDLIRRKKGSGGQEGRARSLILAFLGVAGATFGVAALLINIFEHQQEAKQPFVRVVEVTEETTDPSVWGQNWPREYESYKRTVDAERTRYGGSDAIPAQKLDMDPWLRYMYAGYAFSLDYREARGHAYMLSDQEKTERIKQRPQPGACLHCHASIIPAYRSVGQGDVMAGFAKVNKMPYMEARHLKDDKGNALVEHPVSCVDCHDPKTMRIRVTRPGFLNGIKALKAKEGKPDYDPNRDATHQEMRSYVCGQCHVEYYFKGEEKYLTYPWHNGLKAEEIEKYYDDVGWKDFNNAVTGAPVLKAQHPEFEMWSQGTHGKAGVACTDCHMPYKREGALKYSDHHVRSPLLNIGAACQTCHNVSEDNLRERVYLIQDRTQSLIQRAAHSLEDMMKEIVQTKTAVPDSPGIVKALDMQRKAQWRLDFVYSENSRGFHAAQESARLLGESIDFSRQGQLEAMRARATSPNVAVQPPEIEGVTPTDKAPIVGGVKP